MSHLFPESRQHSAVIMLITQKSNIFLCCGVMVKKLAIMYNNFKRITCKLSEITENFCFMRGAETDNQTRAGTGN